MSLQEVYALPASEIVVWKEYFTIFPFSQDRDDIRTALLAMTVANVSGKTLKKSLDIDEFMPDYAKERSAWNEQKQIKAEKEYVKKLLASGLGVMEQHG